MSVHRPCGTHAQVPREQTSRQRVATHPMRLPVRPPGMGRPLAAPGRREPRGVHRAVVSTGRRGSPPGATLATPELRMDVTGGEEDTGTDRCVEVRVLLGVRRAQDRPQTKNGLP